MSVLTAKANSAEHNLSSGLFDKDCVQDASIMSGQATGDSDAFMDMVCDNLSNGKHTDVNDLVKSDDLSCDSSFDKNSHLVTKTMIEEENNLHSEGVIENDAVSKKAREEWTHVSKDVRLTQLNHLLQKSSIYAEYLVDVIESSKKREKKRALKKEKRQSKGKAISNKQTEPLISGLKKRKAENTLKSSKIAKIEVKADFKVGDMLSVKKLSEDGEEDLIEAKIVDVLYVTKRWKYKVHYIGWNKKKDEWIEKDAIVDDVCKQGDMCDPEDDARKIKTTAAIAKLDKEALLKAKLQTGSDPSHHYAVVNDIRYFNGDEISPIQPELLTGGVLRDYQITGFQWLKVLFNNAVNGILADEMGLGKTIQAIAMVCRLIKVGFHGPFLVCAPLSTVCNWILEFRRFAPQVPVLLYHGSAAERSLLQSCIGKRTSDLSCCPVVVTSYEVLMRDRPSLSKCSWDYLIVDEGHRIKNMNCRLVKELKLLKVTAKVLLTGTPLQNNLAELWSLLNFLLPEVFNDLSTFEAWFDLNDIQKRAKTISSEKDESVVVMLHKILAPFLLRRTKADVDVYLPPKRELLVFAPLVPTQSEYYQAVADRTIRKLLLTKSGKENDITLLSNTSIGEPNINGDVCQEMVTRSATLESRLASQKKDRCALATDSVINVSLNNLMVQLRKCTNHPYLIEYPLVPGTDMYRIDDELINSCGKLQLLDRMLPVLREHQHKVLIFSQMTKILDILEDYCYFRDFSFFRLDGSTKCHLRQEYIDNYNNDPETFLFLLSTRAGGLGINLTAADTVIIYDSDWNPQNDLQAQDRCHRIGQTKPVIVYRLVSANTVDQFMVERAEAKRALERMIINRSKFKGKLAEDLKSNKLGYVESTTLLSMLQKSARKPSSQKPIDDDELGKILDRETVMTCSDEDLNCGVFQSLN